MPVAWSQKPLAMFHVEHCQVGADIEECSTWNIALFQGRKCGGAKTEVER